MKWLRSSGLSVLLMLMYPGIAFSEMYLGGAIGATQYDYQNVNMSMATKLVMGHRFYNKKANSFATELELFDLGEADIDWSGKDVALQMKGANISFVYNVLSSRNLSSFTGFKAGVYNITAERIDRSDGSSEKVRSTGFSAGMAIGGFMLKGKLSIYGELKNYFSVKDLSDGDNNNSVMTHTLNMIYYF